MFIPVRLLSPTPSFLPPDAAVHTKLASSPCPPVPHDKSHGVLLEEHYAGTMWTRARTTPSLRTRLTWDAQASPSPTCRTYRAFTERVCRLALQRNATPPPTPLAGASSQDDQ